MELKDILSLDNEVLSKIQHCHLPSSKTILRLPSLHWAWLCSDMGESLAERKADGFTLLCFAHRQFVEMVQNRYLSKQDEIKRHFLLADFFKGTWSWGMKKPLMLPHFSRTLNANRKVRSISRHFPTSPQPLWFSDTVANLRKLGELPFHLLNAGRIEDLKRDVLGVTVMALSSDYQLLVAGSQDGSMLVWNMEVFEMLHALLGTLISSDGNSLLEKLPRKVCFAVASEDESILAAVKSSSGAGDFSPHNFSQVWSLSDQGLLTDILGGMGAPVTLSALCDSTLVSVSPQHTVSRSEACDTLDTSAVRCLKIAEQNQLLFTGLISGTVLVFPLNSRQDVACMPPPESRKPVSNMANKQEKQLAVAYNDLVLMLDIIRDSWPVINRPAYTFKTQIPGSLISRVAVLADYRVLYGMTSGDLFLYDCPQAQVFPLEGYRSQISCLESSHEEQWALSGFEDSLQCLWDLEFCQQEHETCYYKVLQW
ncbi:LOW QUALITY PROTEIN: NACHT domain- and WD repeat-containing protein 1 [Ciconia maguari]